MLEVLEIDNSPRSFIEESSRPFLNTDHAEVFEQYRQLDPTILLRWKKALEMSLQDFSKDELNILDLGCGTGRFTVLLATLECRRRLTVYALDKAPQMITKLAEKIRERSLTFYSKLKTSWIGSRLSILT